MWTDKDHLEWIYHRLIEVYGENPRVDYMIRLRKIVDNTPASLEEILEDTKELGVNK